MKLRLLISILFIIATSAVAIHELEHINGESSSCQVCVVDDHSVSADIVDDTKDIEIFKFNGIITANLVYSLHAKDHSYQNRAPPIKS
jgi:nitrate reductase NapAB chaperone NapD